MSENPLVPPAAPRDLSELAARARALRGRALDELAADSREVWQEPSVRRKGKAGELLERLLGADAKHRAEPDFRALGVELKTLPLDARGRPRESTFVCSFAMSDAEYADWSTSKLRAKLAHVLFVPLQHRDGRTFIGEPFFFRPTRAQEQILRADFEDLVGLIATGQAEAITAHLGRWLQLRPKAAHGRARTYAYGPEGERIATMPRGFYLRARVTHALQTDPSALDA